MVSNSCNFDFTDVPKFLSFKSTILENRPIFKSKLYAKTLQFEKQF